MKKILKNALILSVLFCLILPAVLSGAATDMPYWYPENPSTFPNFHGSNLKRVVDDADLLTDAQEAELSEMIESIVNKYNYGFVIFTDVSSHGLTKEVYSADFFLFNGYGMGDDFSGSVLFLCMEEGNRGWRTTSLGICRNIFTSNVINDIDDKIDSYIRGGNYFEGFKIYVNCIENLYEDLSNLPSWYPADASPLTDDRENREYTQSVDFSLPRVTDNAKLFSSEEKEQLTESLKAVSEKHGVDFVIFTDTSDHALGTYDYASDFYYYNNYSENGIILFMEENSYIKWVTVGFGSYDELYENFGELNQIMYDDIADGDFKAAADKYIRSASFMLKHKRLPADAGTKAKCLGIGFVAGIVIAFIVISMLKSDMQLHPETAAANYLVGNSLIIRNRQDHFIYTSITKTPRAKESSSGSGRGSSSYSSGSSSNGTSFSSGGRDF